MRKKKEILSVAEDLAGKLSTVCKGSTIKRSDGTTVDASRYAHGAAVALGLLLMYALGEGRPTMDDVLTTALSWSDSQEKKVAEHPENVTSETIDLRDEEADHE